MEENLMYNGDDFDNDSMELEVELAMIFEDEVHQAASETIDEMNDGKTYDIIEEQIIKGLTNVKSIDNIIIAYEPVWAIGTGLTATVEKINEMHSFIRKILSRLYTNNDSDIIPILYGGSVNSDNANELISIDGVNGFLIGGVSLDVIKFTDVVKIVNEQ